MFAIIANTLNIIHIRAKCVTKPDNVEKIWCQTNTMEMKPLSELLNYRRYTSDPFGMLLQSVDGRKEVLKIVRVYSCFRQILR